VGADRCEKQATPRTDELINGKKTSQTHQIAAPQMQTGAMFA